MRLRCANSISIFLRSRREVSVGVGLGDVARHVAGAFVDRARDLAGWRVRSSSAASARRRRSRTCWRDRAASRRRSPACPLQVSILPAGQTVDVAFVIVGEVLARERAVGARRLVEHRDVRLDPVLVDEPAQHLG